MNIIQKFIKNVELNPEKSALFVGDTHLSYQGLLNLVKKYSYNLQQQGVQQGDHIAVILSNSVEFICVMLAAAELQAVIVPLSPTLAMPALAQAFKSNDIKHIVGSHSVLQELIKTKTISISRHQSMLLSVGAAIDGTLCSFNLCQPPETYEIGKFKQPITSPFILSMTSGSTGEPKPIILTQQTKINRANAACELYSITEKDIILAATPLYHSLAMRLVLLSLLEGATSVVMERYTTDKWIDTVIKHKVTFTIAVSSQLKQILTNLQASHKSIESLRCIVSSSALLPEDVKIKLIANLNCDFHECYGTSEVAIVSNLSSGAPQNKIGTVGKACPGVKIKILLEDDTVASPNKPEEIICKTPMLFSGYYKKPQQSRAAMWGEYFRTGDYGSLDHDGYLTFLGRKKEIIVTGGINVYPKDTTTSSFYL